MEKCNGCGLCCHVELCEVGKIAFPDAKAPCPGLLFGKDRTFCKFMVAEIEFGLEPIVQTVLAAGIGCTMQDNQ